MKKRDSLRKAGLSKKIGTLFRKEGLLIEKSVRKVGPYLEKRTVIEKAGLSKKSGTLFGKGKL